MNSNLTLQQMHKEMHDQMHQKQLDKMCQKQWDLYFYNYSNKGSSQMTIRSDHGKYTKRATKKE